jgi:hypothetical protein
VTGSFIDVTIYFNPFHRRKHDRRTRSENPPPPIGILHFC